MRLSGSAMLQVKSVSISTVHSRHSEKGSNSCSVQLVKAKESLVGDHFPFFCSQHDQRNLLPTWSVVPVSFGRSCKAGAIGTAALALFMIEVEQTCPPKTHWPARVGFHCVQMTLGWNFGLLQLVWLLEGPVPISSNAPFALFGWVIETANVSVYPHTQRVSARRAQAWLCLYGHMT